MGALQGLASIEDLTALMRAAAEMAVEGFGRRVTYSRKVFIPLTQLCRDVCGYCAFARAPRSDKTAFLSIEQVLAIAQAGVAAGCHEALFTLGEKPELRYSSAREALERMGYATTIDYLEHAAKSVFEKTGLLPHLNPGVLTPDQLMRLKPVAASMGLMLESTSHRLMQRHAAHWKAPDKEPEARLDTLRHAGELAIPYTTGILIGIGETRIERIEALLAIRELHERHGNIQEVIIQNFRAKPGTRMAHVREPETTELCWSIAIARLILGPSMSIQAPPNLNPGELDALVRAGINDWGGVSPVTADHVNPEAPWPHLTTLEEETRLAGRILTQRLAIVPRYAREPARWLPDAQRVAVLRRTDAGGFARSDAWHAGAGDAPPPHAMMLLRNRTLARTRTTAVSRIVARAGAGRSLSETEIASLFSADGADFSFITQAANELRIEACGAAVSYVVNRNINYTNVCSYSCGFCAFAKGRSARSLRGPAYELDLAEIAFRVTEAAARGATEVCLQGGIHPKFNGDTYLNILSAVKAAVPTIHVHAFSPLEIQHGSQTLGLPLTEYLMRLKARGLATLPGTAAEILDDEVRRLICPDKLTTEEWLEVMRAAHRIGLRSTATIMFGHVETPQHWARHLLRIRSLQQETGGFTEFVPLPFVHMESPLWKRGHARSGPTFREALLMHSVARLALHPLIPNIQASWVKMGLDGALACCDAGANDMGGTLMNESITRAAGGVNGQELDAATLSQAIRTIGRLPQQRTTGYQAVRTRNQPLESPAFNSP
jgi:FO synthase